LEKKFKLIIKDETWSSSNSLPFKRLKIKCRNRLLPLKGDFDPVNARGKHLNYQDWNKLITDPNTIILDVRNNYETEIGTFKNSIIPKMNNLTEFPHFVDKELSETKKKKIAMFCTGGIRCEKATSLLKKKGFKNIYHLQGASFNTLMIYQKKKTYLKVNVMFLIKELL